MHGTEELLEVRCGCTPPVTPHVLWRAEMTKDCDPARVAMLWEDAVASDRWLAYLQVLTTEQGRQFVSLYALACRCIDSDAEAAVVAIAQS